MAELDDRGLPVAGPPRDDDEGVMKEDGPLEAALTEIDAMCKARGEVMSIKPTHVMWPDGAPDYGPDGVMLNSEAHTTEQWGRIGKFLSEVTKRH